MFHKESLKGLVQDYVISFTENKNGYPFLPLRVDNYVVIRSFT